MPTENKVRSSTRWSKKDEGRMHDQEQEQQEPGVAKGRGARSSIEEKQDEGRMHDQEKEERGVCQRRIKYEVR